MSKKIKKIYDCPIDFTMSLISRKWSIWILWTLLDRPYRFGELKNKIPNINEKMLISELKKFENYNIVKREVYPEVPPKVIYSLTTYGKNLKPILLQIKIWGDNHLDIQ